MGVNFSFFILHSVVITDILSHVSDKNFVKVTVLLNKLQKSCFDEIFLVREFLVFPHCTVIHGSIKNTA